jgi:lactate permease
LRCSPWSPSSSSSAAISPQNLAIGAAAVGLAGREGDLFRKVLGWSLVLILAMCVLVYLQSTAVLDWMVVK